MPRQVIEEEKLGTQRAVLADALIQRVGFVRVGLCLASIILAALTTIMMAG
ncbi:MAG: hypothetical protein IPH22_01295 [Nitrosomonas sp.]|nr:hypothetical protein [Nitrosomonas sp.]